MDAVVLVDAVPDFFVVLVLLVPAFALMVMVDELLVKPPVVDELELWKNYGFLFQQISRFPQDFLLETKECYVIFDI